MFDPEVFDPDCDAGYPPQEVAYRQARRELVHKALFQGRRPGRRWRGIAPDCSRSPEQAADSFAIATIGLRLNLAALARLRDLHPTQLQLKGQVEAILGKAGNFRLALESASAGCANLLDEHSSRKWWFDTGDGMLDVPALVAAAFDAASAIEEAAVRGLAAISKSSYCAPSPSELRGAAITKLALLYEEHFGKLPGSGQGYFMRLVECLFANEGIESSSLYQDTLLALRRLKGRRGSKAK